jgi:hypothetical protein
VEGGVGGNARGRRGAGCRGAPRPHRSGASAAMLGVGAAGNVVLGVGGDGRRRWRCAAAACAGRRRRAHQASRGERVSGGDRCVATAAARSVRGVGGTVGRRSARCAAAQTRARRRIDDGRRRRESRSSGASGRRVEGSAASGWSSLARIWRQGGGVVAWRRRCRSAEGGRVAAVVGERGGGVGDAGGQCDGGISGARRAGGVSVGEPVGGE